MSCSENTGCATAQQKKDQQDEADLKHNLGMIKNKIVILSGKGGVGKSTVATNLALCLATKGHSVGLLDVDVHGPSVPKLLGLEGMTLNSSPGGRIEPVVHESGLKVVSIGFMLPSDKDPVIWRGPMKYGVIKQFLKDVHWGHLDYLVVDSPPGTGDEPLAVCQLIGDSQGAIVVTTPQDVALTDVKRSISFCDAAEMPVIGVIENMSGFVCPHCGERTDLFKSGGGKTMAAEMEVPFLGDIPLTADVVHMGDSGQPFFCHADNKDHGAVKAFDSIVSTVVETIQEKNKMEDL
jgi:ATP-binding protein involved in chromosome partitioning